MARIMQPNTANVLFVYDNVLKSPDPYILKSIKTVYRKSFEGFVDFTLLDTLDDRALFYYTLGRDTKDLLEWVSTCKYDYQKFYRRLKNKLDALYIDSTELNMYKTMKIFAHSYCIDKIYVWNEDYDKRQHMDLSDLIKDGAKITYVTGPFEKVLNDIGNVNVVYDWDVDRVYDVIESNNFDEIFFGVASYRFNQTDPKMKELLKKYSNIGSYSIYNAPIEELYVG